MKKYLALAGAVSLAATAITADAKNPHPEPEYEISNLECSCDWSAAPGSCTVSWDDVDASAYGADIEFEAEWMDGSGVEMKTEAELELDDLWQCEAGVCSATAEFVLPGGYPAEAEVEFEARVKGFDNGRDGPKPRNFRKETADCNLPEPVDG